MTVSIIADQSATGAKISALVPWLIASGETRKAAVTRRAMPVVVIRESQRASSASAPARQAADRMFSRYAREPNGMTSAQARPSRTYRGNPGG